MSRMGTISLTCAFKRSVSFAGTPGTGRGSRIRRVSREYVNSRSRLKGISRDTSLCRSEGLIPVIIGDSSHNNRSWDMNLSDERNASWHLNHRQGNKINDRLSSRLASLRKNPLGAVKNALSRRIPFEIEFLSERRKRPFSEARKRIVCKEGRLP